MLDSWSVCLQTAVIGTFIPWNNQVIKFIVISVLRKHQPISGFAGCIPRTLGLVSANLTAITAAMTHATTLVWSTTATEIWFKHRSWCATGLKPNLGFGLWLDLRKHWVLPLALSRKWPSRSTTATGCLGQCPGLTRFQSAFDRSFLCTARSIQTFTQLLFARVPSMFEVSIVLSLQVTTTFQAGPPRSTIHAPGFPTCWPQHRFRFIPLQTQDLLASILFCSFQSPNCASLTRYVTTFVIAELPHCAIVIWLVITPTPLAVSESLQMHD